MSGAAFGVLIAIVTVALGVIGLFYTARAQAREQSVKRIEAMQAKYNEGFAAGVANAAPTADLLRSQRDDARRERDNERAERLAAEHRVQQLEDERARGWK